MMDTSLGQQLMRKMMDAQIRKTTMANASLPQQLDALFAEALAPAHGYALPARDLIAIGQSSAEGNGEACGA